MSIKGEKYSSKKAEAKHEKTEGKAERKMEYGAKANSGKTRVSPLNTHLRDMQKESRRLKGLYDPTARPGFQFGKGTE